MATSVRASPAYADEMETSDRDGLFPEQVDDCCRGHSERQSAGLRARARVVDPRAVIHDVGIVWRCDRPSRTAGAHAVPTDACTRQPVWSSHRLGPVCTSARAGSEGRTGFRCTRDSSGRGSARGALGLWGHHRPDADFWGAAKLTVRTSACGSPQPRLPNMYGYAIWC